MQIRLQEGAIGRKVNHQFVDLTKGQHAVVELIIEQMAAALAVIGDEVFVVAGNVNALHMLRRAKPHQYPFALVEAENGLVVEHVGQLVDRGWRP